MSEGPGGNGRPRILCVDDEEFVLDGLRDTLRRAFEVHTATRAIAGPDHAPQGAGRLRGDPLGHAHARHVGRGVPARGAHGGAERRAHAADRICRHRFGHSRRQRCPAVSLPDQAVRRQSSWCARASLRSPSTASITAERVLLEQTLRGSVNALVEVLALASPAAFGRAGRVREFVGMLADEIELENRWEVEVAAMLAHIGAVTLPADTAEKLYAGEVLTPAETAMVDRMPKSARRLLANIPRLEGVIAILDAFHNPAALPADEIPAGARILRDRGRLRGARIRRTERKRGARRDARPRSIRPGSAGRVQRGGRRRPRFADDPGAAAGRLAHRHVAGRRRAHARRRVCSSPEATW